MASDESDGDPETRDADPYLEVTAAMPTGLIVTVNESTHHAPSRGRFKVLRAHDDGTLDLEQQYVSHRGDIYYRFQEADDGGVELVELDDEGHGTDWTEVLTIEVVGIDS